MHLAKALCGAIVLAGCAATNHEVGTTTTTSATTTSPRTVEPVAPRESIPTAADPRVASSSQDAYPDKYRGYAPADQRDDAREAAEKALRSFQKPTAFALIAKGVSCWLTATVGDAYDTAWAAAGETGNTQRARLCGELAGLVYNDIDSAMGAYRMLRIPDPVTAQAFEAKVRQLGATEESSRRVALTALARSVAHTANEHLGMKTGLAIANWGDDKSMATPLLQNRYELGSLMTMDAGPVTPSARAAALLFAMDRVDSTRNVSAKYQVYALGGVLQDLFGVQAPAVPEAELGSYLANAARAAGHPVTAVTPSETLERAREGIMCGIADRLRDVLPKVGAPLDEIVAAIAKKHTCE